MSMQPLPEPGEHSVDYLLAEIETLRSLRSDISSNGESRANIFMAVVSGALAGLGFLYQSSSLGKILPLITGIVLVGLLLLGFMTFGRVIERDISLKLYSRGLNRIRNYFVQLDPELSQYLMLPIYDDKPKFSSLGWRRGGRVFALESTVAVINGIVATVAVSAFAIGIVHLEIAPVVIFAICAFLVVCFAQYRYMTHQYRNAERDWKAHFPESKA